MTPRLAAALRELDEAVKEEVAAALEAASRGHAPAVDEVAQRRAIEGLKKRGMLPTTYKKTAKR